MRLYEGQVSNYQQFAEAQAAQLGRSFEELTDPQRSATVSGAALPLACEPSDSGGTRSVLTALL